MRNGERCSSYAAFLADNLSRPNLHIVTHALVEKVLIDDTKRAYAVQYNQFGVRKIVHANKEIILSAGSVGSPQILMLSGVGPRDHLQSHGVIKLINKSPLEYLNLYLHLIDTRRRGQPSRLQFAGSCHGRVRTVYTQRYDCFLG